jgi:hypothetical protein
MFGGKIFAEIKAVGGLLFGLKSDFADAKLTWVAVQKDIADVKAVLAEVRALTGHTATVTALAAQASVPTSVPVTLPPAPAVAAPSLGQQLGGIVGGVTKGIESVIPKP